jgi:hypothetical protein
VGQDERSPDRLRQALERVGRNDYSMTRHPVCDRAAEQEAHHHGDH